MALSYKARRRWSLVVLLVVLPAYIVAVVTLITSLPRPPLVVEFLIYVVAGIAFFFPFRPVFRGIGKPDPDAPEDPS